MIMLARASSNLCHMTLKYEPWRWQLQWL
jgi:hypothetical protein